MHASGWETSPMNTTPIPPMLHQIPRLSDAEYNALHLLFCEGLRINPELSRSPNVMGALIALQNAKPCEVKLPGEQ